MPLSIPAPRVERKRKRKNEAFPKPSTTRPFLWVVKQGDRYFYFRGPEGKPVWGPFLTRAQRFDSEDAAWQAARWAGGVALELEAAP